MDAREGVSDLDGRDDKFQPSSLKTPNVFLHP